MAAPGGPWQLLAALGGPSLLVRPLLAPRFAAPWRRLAGPGGLAAPGGPWRPLAVPAGPMVAPGCSRRPLAALGGPWLLQVAPGGTCPLARLESCVENSKNNAVENCVET